MKGSIGDTGLIVLILLVAVFGIMIALLLSGALSSADPAVFSTVFGNVNSALKILVDVVLLIYIMLNVVVMAAAYFIKSHPIFAMASLLFLGIEMILAVVASNLFNALISNSVFVSIGNTYLSTVITLFRILPFATLLFGLLLIYLQFGKPQQVL